MPRRREAEISDELFRHYLEQLPMVAVLLWEDGTAKEAAENAADLIEACLKVAEEFEP